MIRGMSLRKMPKNSAVSFHAAVVSKEMGYLAPPSTVTQPLVPA